MASLWQLGSPLVESKFCQNRVRLSGVRHCCGSSVRFSKFNRLKVVCRDSNDQQSNNKTERTGIQLYSEIERLLTETVRQSQDGWGSSRDCQEVEGAWVLRPKNSKPVAVVHFVGDIFVGAAPQLTYCLFLERVSEKGLLVIVTPYASGFDHFLIADEVQFKYDRCLRALHETVQDLPSFGIGHSLGSVIHPFDWFKDASLAVPLFSPVLLPMAQSIVPILSQLASSPTIRFGAEMTMKNLETLSPSIMKQVIPLVEQLPPLYMEMANGRENFSTKPEETRRLIKSYYGISRNFLVKFKDDTIDETPTNPDILFPEDSIDPRPVCRPGPPPLSVKVLSSAISSVLDMSIRSLPGDHGLPLQQALPDVPPGMVDAVNRGGELWANLTAGTPLETVAKEVTNSLGVDSTALRADLSNEFDLLVDTISAWMITNAGKTGSRLLKPQEATNDLKLIQIC